MSNKQKALGAYYTPKSVTDALCQWGVRNSEETILEPSFGGCGFLMSIKNRLAELGAVNPMSQLYGCDIDPYAFEILKNILPNEYENQFIEGDFLFTDSNSFRKERFPVIVGNPPYLSISAMKGKKLSYWNILKSYDGMFNKRASLWSYFILHSLNFLEKGGRMAWVLPYSLLFTDYGKKIQNILCQRFQKVDIIKINQSFFVTEGTDEKTLLLLCENYLNGNCEIKIHTYNYLLDGLQAVVNGNNRNNSENIYSSVELLLNNVDQYKLGDMCEIKIGIVIGASRELIYSRRSINTYNLSTEFYYPILNRSSYLKGVDITETEINGVDEKVPRYLINFNSLKEKDNILFDSIVSDIPKKIFDDNTTFDNRSSWYDYDDKKIPDSFLVYFNKMGPRIVYNTGKVNSTNSIHRLYFKEQFKEETIMKLVAISSVTSVTKYHAEKVGRCYKSGVLKLEPSDAKKLLICIPKKYDKKKVDEIFNKINFYLKSKEDEKAMTVADEFVFGSCNKIQIDGMNSLLATTQLHRQIENHK